MTGLISAQDAEDLATIAKGAGISTGDYCEIGSYMGMSAHAILGGMPKDRRLWCYDFFEPEKYRTFQGQLAEHCQGWRTVAIPGDFRKTLPGTLPETIAFAFVDHDHQLEATISAYNLLWPRLSEGGVLLFHDYLHADYPGPTPFLKNLPHRRAVERAGLIGFVKNESIT